MSKWLDRNEIMVVLGNKYILWLGRNEWCCVMNVLDKCLLGLVVINALKLLFNLLKHVFLLFLEYTSHRVLLFLFPLSHLCSFLSLFVELASAMYSYPSSQTSKFVELLNSQQSISFGNYEDIVSLSSKLRI